MPAALRLKHRQTGRLGRSPALSPNNAPHEYRQLALDN
jgi:hypothetical protein